MINEEITLMSTFSERALRERAQLDGQGLDRHLFRKVFSHTKYFYGLRRQQILRQQFEYANGRRVLEIGSQCWFQWIESFQIKPASLACINISSKAIEQGEQKAKTSRVRPQFHLMDAHRLEFADSTFDMVFGDSILHHLDLLKALEEINRVLKPKGRIVFCEPLGINPVGKLVRFLTPQARTQDEHALSLKDLSAIEQHFETRFYYEQLLSVPFGVISRMLFSAPDNKMMKAAFQVDRFIDSNFPPARSLYRHIIISAISRKFSREADQNFKELRNAS